MLLLSLGWYVQSCSHPARFCRSFTKPLLFAVRRLPQQFNVLFPGETLFRGSNPRAAYDILPGDPSPKDSVWALYARSQLLFVSAVHVKHSDRLTEQAKAEFAVRAWLETERIEAQLDLHTCDVEKATSECHCILFFRFVYGR